MNLPAPAQGLRRWPSLTSFFQRGPTPNEIWYALGAQNQAAFGASAVSANFISAHIFAVSRSLRLDRLAMEVTVAGAAGSASRVGIYRATSLTNKYPSSRVVDSGEFDTTGTGVMAATVAATLSPGVYWAAILSKGGPTARRHAAQGLVSSIGASSDLVTLGIILRVALTYAELPATYPAGATQSTAVGDCPVIAARFSG